MHHRRKIHGRNSRAQELDLLLEIPLCDFAISRPVGTSELLGSTTCADRNISRSTNSEFMGCRWRGHEPDALE